ncbi:MAG: type II toxin-antitoxin system VapC family toxin [Terracidiphilus sp.]
MKYLLDTHVFLWVAAAPEKLSRKASEIIPDPGNEFFLSIATPWELAIKTNTGKLDAAGLLRDLEAGVFAADLEILPASVSQVIRAGLLPYYHRDPFDRLLVAQALDQRLPILSKDRLLDRYGVKRIWN